MGPAVRVLACAVALAAASGRAAATEHLRPDPVRFLTGAAASPWDRIECLRDASPHLVRERFLRGTMQRDFWGGGIVDGFGGERTPASSDFLLHYAPGWERPQHAIPVLLLHGAGSNANHSFVGRWPDGRGGLMRHLASRRLAVFALTFATPHGDNHLQAEVVADAIERVRRVTGAPQVDLVAHSKGAVAARIYVSGVGRPWATAYRGDVRRLLLLATPSRGIDFPFRHPASAALLFRLRDIAFPSSRDVSYGVDRSGESIFSGAFDGHIQMVSDLSAIHPPDPLEVDWLVSYTGGWGFLGHYPGIREAVRRGGNLIRRLEEAGIDPRIELSVLAGRRRLFDRFTETGIERDAITGEMDGPSDGLVFRASLTATSGLTRRGARLQALTELPINHAECVYHPLALGWIERQLTGSP